MARPIFLLGHSSVHLRREPSNKVFHFPKSGLFQRQALNQHSTPDPPSFSARISIRPIHLPIWTLSICSEYPRSTRPLESNLDHGLPLLSMRASHCKQGAFRSSILPKAFHLVIHSPHREQSSESVPSSSAHPRTDGTRPRACKRQHHKNERQEHKTTEKPGHNLQTDKKRFRHIDILRHRHTDDCGTKVFFLLLLFFSLLRSSVRRHDMRAQHDACRSIPSCGGRKVFCFRAVLRSCFRAFLRATR